MSEREKQLAEAKLVYNAAVDVAYADYDAADVAYRAARAAAANKSAAASSAAHAVLSIADATYAATLARIDREYPA